MPTLNSEGPPMRAMFPILVLLTAAPAFAQSYPQQYLPQQEAAVTAYPQVPTTYPQVQYQPQPVQQPQPAPGYYDYHPTDAGQSVVTDVRQMNF